MKRLNILFGVLLFLLTAWSTSGLAEKSKTPVINDREQSESQVQTDKDQNGLQPTLPGQVQAEPQPPKPQPAAPNYDLSWFSINGGGTHSGASTNYELGYSIGQSVAGEGNSSNYELGIGFWYGAGLGCLAIPGDLNASNGLTLGDVIHLLNFLFDRDKPPCIGIDPGNCWAFTPVCRGDVNASGTLTLGDVVHLLNYLFDRDKPPCIGIDPGNCWTPVPSPACCQPVP